MGRRVSTDAEGLITGIAGAVIATLGLIGSAEAVTVQISAVVANAENDVRTLAKVLL